jgi:hypothetical protein
MHTNGQISEKSSHRYESHPLVDLVARSVEYLLYLAGLIESNRSSLLDWFDPWISSKWGVSFNEAELEKKRMWSEALKRRQSSGLPARRFMAHGFGS